MHMNRRILAIDDNSDNLALLEALLPEYRLELASSGAEGLEKARTFRPDLVLLDVHMPGMDGFATLEAMRRDSRIDHIPVILLTAAFKDPDSIRRGLELGASEYLTKPLQTEELLVRVHAVLRAASAERELEQLRRDFSAMLLHDLRAPLESVRLALSLLDRQASEPQHQLVSLARTGLSEVEDLVEGLIEGYRLDEGELPLEPSEFDLAPLCAEVAQQAALQARQRGMDIRLAVPPDVRCRADRRIVRRVLANLVGNAIKYADPGDIVVSAAVTAEQVQVEVQDQGPGMAPDVAEHAFDRYFHQSRRREKESGGLGLGLAFCRQAIEAHGGTIAVQTQIGQPTSIGFTLPAAPLSV